MGVRSAYNLKYQAGVDAPLAVKSGSAVGRTTVIFDSLMYLARELSNNE